MTEVVSQVWRVDVEHQTLNREPVPEAWQRLGGRGLLARILLDEVDATCDPLGPQNKLVFAPGLLVGPHAVIDRPNIDWREVASDRRHKGIECWRPDGPAHGNDGHSLR